MPELESILDFLRAQPTFTLFVVIGFGYIVGAIRIAGISLGAVAGTLLIGIVLGRFGFRITPAAQAVGFAIFIFSVGYQAGPRFVEIIKSQGLRYLALAVVVCGIGVASALAAGWILDLPPGGTAGLMSGALTTTPALAAAQNAVRDGIAVLPVGTDPEQVIVEIGTSYAITYVVGMLGLILAVKLLPRVAGFDLAQEARKLDLATGSRTVRQLQARAYRVSNARFLNRAISQLASEFWDGFAVVRLRRQGQWLEIEPGHSLESDDELCVYGDAGLFRSGLERIGDEIAVPEDFEQSTVLTQVVVARREVVGAPLADLRLSVQHGLVAVQVRRDGLFLPLEPSLVLQRGDVLSVVGPRASVATLAGRVGPVEADPSHTDMMAFAFGIAGGSIIGILSITVGGIPLGFGTAGGLLAAGIITGWLSSVRPSIGKFPLAARWILMEFGLLLFMCGVGLQAGTGIVETFRSSGAALVLAAAVVVVLPVIGGYFFGRKVLRLSPVVLMGALTGAMTSGPALSLVTAEARSAAPVLGYSGTYAFACILLAVAGTLVMLIA
jgi:putative transport protein